MLHYSKAFPVNYTVPFVTRFERSEMFGELERANFLEDFKIFPKPHIRVYYNWACAELSESHSNIKTNLVKQLLNSVITKYRDLSAFRMQINYFPKLMAELNR